jgi:hypothetical protein
MEACRWVVGVAAAACMSIGCGSSPSSSSPGDGGEPGSDSATGGNDATGGSDATGGGDATGGSDATSVTDATGGSDGSGGGGDSGGAGKDGGADAGHDAGGSSPGSDGGLISCTNQQAAGDAGSATAPGVVAGMVPGPGTFVSGCQIFPGNNAWNVTVTSTSIPVVTSQYTGLPTSTHLHPDVGGYTTNTGGIPFDVVPASQPNVQITFGCWANESDPGPAGWTSGPTASNSDCQGEGSGDIGVTAWPFPNGLEIEGDPSPTSGGTPGDLAGGDQHALVLQQGAVCGAACTLWESWNTVGGTTAPWNAANGAKWDLMSNGLRTLDWTSADAAGLSVFAGLMKLSEIKAGVINHAIRVTFNDTYAAHVAPATHFAGHDYGATYPPMGLRLRLHTGIDTSTFSAGSKVVVTAMQTYGIIVADIGSDWYFQGDSNDGWNAMDVTDTIVNEMVQDFENVHGSDFDVLDTGTPSTQ